MIKQVKLKCFRKHTDRTFDFNLGLNALRGANEEGKSTVIEGVCYALFGSKALRVTLDETVTWGHKVSELRAECILSHGGVDYTFTRSKAGAEVNYPGGKVTGQTEVSAFASQLLGCDAKVASALMLATQNSLRGALDEGPAAVSGLMSKLANFDLIDRLVEAAQGQLTLGSEAPVREKLEAAKARVEELENTMPSGAAVDMFAELQAQAEAALAERQAAEAPAGEALRAAAEALAQANERNAERERVAQAVSKLQGQSLTIENQIKALVPKVAAGVAPDLIEAARARIEEAKGYEAAAAAWREVTSLPEYPAVYWDGPYAGFELEMGQAAKAVDDAKEKRINAANAVARAEAKLITADKCPTCGRASLTDEHVAKHNAEVRAAVADLREQMAAATRAQEKAVAEYSEYLAIAKAAGKFSAVADKYRGSPYPIEVNDDYFPPRVSWTGVEPRTADMRELKRQLEEMESKTRQAAVAEGQIAALKAQLAEIQQELQKLGDQLDATPHTDTTQLKELHDAHSSALQAIIQAIEEHRSLAAAYAQQKQAAELAMAAHARELATCKERLEELQADLQALIRNNILVAKLRKLKPSITDYLWSQVLAAVSNFFSTLRGENSVVTKDANGFRVNGHSVDSLSGSTLDVLALAIRVALTKTFIPQATFVILDEPAAGCDVSRTSGLLGFLASVGFQQTILASHDELSEAVADNVIALGT